MLPSTPPWLSGSALDEEAIKKFEHAWRNGERPNLADHLTDPDDHALLIELVHVELELRFRQQESPRIEDYLERFPVLETQPGALRDLLRAEIENRQRYSSTPDLQEYLHRFPQQQAIVQQLFTSDTTTLSSPQHSRLPRTEAFPNVPGYTIEEELGQGGMGVVYRATQTKLQRAVAIKTLLYGVASTTELKRRFRSEAEAIARLDHPHLVPIYEVGEWTPEGAGTAIPYFVMKFYPGGSLANISAGPDTDTNENARTLETIAQAVHHAHQRGILHRDLKPSNILLDEKGEPHVVDFGLAGRFDPSDPKSMTATIMGTPAYMAPEQARSPSQVTTSADVYGLGAILYQLLTGKAPFYSESPMAVLEQVIHQQPQRPMLLNPAIPRDLETICLKCLEKDPAQRYESAAALAQELERFRTGRSILARPTPSWEKAWRTVKRHPVIATLCALTVGLLITSVVVLAVSNYRIREKETETMNALFREKWANTELMNTFNREQQLLYGKRINSVSRLWNSNQLQQAWEELDACPSQFRGWEWHYFNGLRDKPPLTIRTPDVVTRCISFLSDSELLSADDNGMVRIWDWKKMQSRHTWKATPEAPRAVAVNPGQRLLAICDQDDLYLWNYETRQRVAKLPGSTWVAFSRDGQYLASAECVQGKNTPDVLVWKTGSWKEVLRLSGHKRQTLNGTFSPDSQILATCSSDRTVRRWKLSTGQPVGEPWVRALPTFRLAYLPDGQHIAEAQPSAMLWTDAITGKEKGRYNWAAIAQPLVMTARVQVTTGPHSHYIGVSGPSHDIQLWDIQRNRSLAVMRGHELHIGGLEFSPNGKHLASISNDQTIRIWDFDQPVEYQSLGSINFLVTNMALSSEGRFLAGIPNSHSQLSGSDLVQLFDTSNGNATGVFPGISTACFTPDGMLITAQSAGGVQCWDVAARQSLWHYRAPGRRCTALCLSSDGRSVIAAEHGGIVSYLDRVTGALQRSFSVAERFTGIASISPQANRLAIVTPKEVQLWDLEQQRNLAGFPMNGTRQMAFSADGKVLATAEADRVVRLRDAATGKVLISFPGHPRTINSLAFNADGKRLVSSCADGLVRIWDVQTGLELAALPGQFEESILVTWDHQHDRIIGVDTKIHIWKSMNKEMKIQIPSSNTSGPVDNSQTPSAFQPEPGNGKG